MTPVLKVLLEILRIIRFARNHIKRLTGCGASLLSLLGRKLNLWWGFWLGKSGSFGCPKPADRPFLGTEAGSYSASTISAVVREYVVAASSAPASASLPSLHERTERQSATVAQTVDVDPPVVVNPSTGHPHAPNPPHSLEGSSLVNRSSVRMSAVSIRSRASDRFSILTNSGESIRAPLGQPSRLPRATDRRFGGGPDPSRATEHPPPAPTSSLEINTTNSPSSTPGDGRLLSPPPMNKIPTRPSLTSVDVDIENASTEPLPIISSTHPPQITDEPFSIDYASVHSSLDPPAVDLHEEPLPGSPTSSVSASATLDYSVPEGRFVQLINSDQVPRYTKDIKIPRVGTVFGVKPLTSEFPYFPEPRGSEQDSLQQDCRPWKPATHPNGALYFYDQERRLFTDTDMHDSTMREEIEDFHDYLQRLIHNDQLSIPSNNYDLVLDITVIEDRRISWSYYYACHETRCLFWLETYDASYMISELFGVKSPAHIKHRLESLYWNHWSLFPVVFCDRRLPLDAYDELMGTLMHGCVDVTISKSSTETFDDDTMRRWIQLVQGAKEAKGGLVYYTAGITRLLSVFAHRRFLHFHGQRHAWLVRDQTVYDKPRHERSLLITIMSPLLFLAPEVHLREMERLGTNEVIIEAVWKSFMTKMLGEWESVILWSTVMLSANVGFLAIPGVIVSNPSDDLTSASQAVVVTPISHIASCLSVEASIGSIIIGLLLVRLNRTKHKEGPAGASTYLHQTTHRVFGLEPMAIFFSLPWALLMWSMAIFFTALLLFHFSNTTFWPRVSAAIMSVLMVILVGWCLRLSWELVEDDDVWQKSLAVLWRTGGALFEFVKGFKPFHTRRVPRDERITLTGRLSDVRV